MTAVELRFRLATPLARPGMPIHIESALLYAAIFAGMPEPQAWRHLNAAIPWHGDRSSGCYRASAIFFQPRGAFTRYATRRFDPQEYGEDIARGIVAAKPATQVNLQSGPVRGRLDFFPMLWADSGTAWLDVDSLDDLQALLEHFRHVGKHTAQGYGQLALESGVSVTVHRSDATDAWQRRILPFPVPGAQPIRATVSPPYWDRRRQQNAFLHPAIMSGEYGVCG